MKKTILSALGTFIIFAILNTQVNAQQKIGYISVNYILEQIPEVKAAETDLNKIKSEYDTLFQGKVKVLQAKVADFEKSKASLSEILKADKEKEIQSLQAQAEEFRKNANASLQKKQLELGQPFLKKINDALQLVVKENGYQFVINNDVTQSSIFAFAPEEANISALVLKKMGFAAQASIAEPKKK